ncbi:MAG: biotin--[acetyl-CoA-carboxylase] ligase [Candidatus Rokubacteria bacterium]|nr:biotin--[acetyl-CoA-carboxylase] ligase [Candidatus Rokubacteria bacterium]
MMLVTDRLTIDGIRRALVPDSVVGSRIHLFDEVASTNAALRRLAREGAPAGTVVLAESQTAGRGRHGRPWFSPAGVNFYASVLLRPTAAVHELGVFSFITSLAVGDTLRHLGLDPAIKWPNDVLLEGKKVSGSLAESALSGDGVGHVILGVGVNLNVDVATLHAALGSAGVFATSVAAVTGREVDRNAFASSYLTHLDAWARRWEADGTPAVLAAWRGRDILGGRRVEVRGVRDTFEGRVISVDERGALVVIDSRGVRHALTSEEVRLAD